MRGIPLFRTANACLACHNQLVTASGEDVSIGAAWRGSIMANSARDPYWQASVRREVMDRPALQRAIEDQCATCHMPMARAHARANGRAGEVFRHLPIAHAATDARASEAAEEAALAADGVSCTLCHQVTPEKLGTPDSFTGGFFVDRTRRPGERPIFGPFAIDRGRTTIMRSATGFVPTEATHIQASELCATCHTLYTHARGADGASIARLPEQVPYQEWQHSAYRGERSCQSCHMPVVTEPIAIAGVLGEPRAGLSRHAFRGGNFFMLEMLQRYRAELGVEALPSELRASARDTLAHLQSDTARVTIADARVIDASPGDRSSASRASPALPATSVSPILSVSPESPASPSDAPRGARQLAFDVAIENLAGHKLPTGYPSRRAWLHVLVRDRQGRVLFESGAFRRDGAIQGNDNDVDPQAVEPHYTEIRRRDDVQIYESMLVDAEGRVTTGLLSGVRFVKDNRLLPRGFDKATAAPDIAVQGGAAADPDFAAGADRVRYLVSVGDAPGPLHIEAELWFQPIAFRWAENLRPYASAVEPRRFVALYASMAGGSARILARHALTSP